MSARGTVLEWRRQAWAPHRRRTTLLIALGLGLAIFATAAVVAVGKPDTDEAVVYFTLQPTAEQVAQVRTACPGFGKATLEPPDKNQLASSLRYPIRYLITDAGPKDKAALYRCLHEQNVNVSETRNGD